LQSRFERLGHFQRLLGAAVHYIMQVRVSCHLDTVALIILMTQTQQASNIRGRRLNANISHLYKILLPVLVNIQKHSKTQFVQCRVEQEVQARERMDLSNHQKGQYYGLRPLNFLAACRSPQAEGGEA